MWTCVEEAVSVDSLEIDISAEKADQAVEDVALGDICNEDRDVISFHHQNASFSRNPAKMGIIL